MDCELGSEVLLRTPSPQFLLVISMIPLLSTTAAMPEQ